MDCSECGGPHALIRVPGGHKTPIVCARGGPEPGLDPKKGTVYSRLPGPKSAPVVEPEDWEALLNRCMKNRRDELIEDFRGALQVLGPAGIRAALDRDDDDDDPEGTGDPGPEPRPPDGGDSGGEGGMRGPRGGRSPAREPRSRDVDIGDWIDGSEARLRDLLAPVDAAENPYRFGSWLFAYRLVAPEPPPPVSLPDLRRDLLESVGSERAGRLGGGLRTLTTRRESTKARSSVG